jgi:LmbE family N-acetylglucosaminyl deacetylase
MEWSDFEGADVLVVVGHPDDETLGCGATISKLTASGASARVLAPVRREDPRGVQWWDELLTWFAKACQRIGAEAILDNERIGEGQAERDLQTLHSLVVPYVEAADIVFTHWHGDVHQVHRAVSRSVEIATRPFRRRKEVFLFEVPTSTDQAYEMTFSPNTYSVLSEEHVAAKLEALSYYETEHDAGRTVDGVNLLMQVRGRAVGVDHAEAFVTARRFL